MTRKITPAQLDEIEAVAKRALSGDGPWTFQRWGGQNQNGDYAESILFDSRGESLTYGLPNLEGDHIAMMDPATTLALIAEVRELRAKVERVRDIVGDTQDLDPDQGGCEGAWDAQLLEILAALGEEA